MGPLAVQQSMEMLQEDKLGNKIRGIPSWRMLAGELDELGLLRVSLAKELFIMYRSA